MPVLSSFDMAMLVSVAPKLFITYAKLKHGTVSAVEVKALSNTYEIHVGDVSLPDCPRYAHLQAPVSPSPCI